MCADDGDEDEDDMGIAPWWRCADGLGAGTRADATVDDEQSHDVYVWTSVMTLPAERVLPYSYSLSSSSSESEVDGASVARARWAETEAEADGDRPGAYALLLWTWPLGLCLAAVASEESVSLSGSGAGTRIMGLLMRWISLLPSLSSSLSSS